MAEAKDYRGGCMTNEVVKTGAHALLQRIQNALY